MVIWGRGGTQRLLAPVSEGPGPQGPPTTHSWLRVQLPDSRSHSLKERKGSSRPACCSTEESWWDAGWPGRVSHYRLLLRILTEHLCNAAQGAQCQPRWEWELMEPYMGWGHTGTSAGKL